MLHCLPGSQLRVRPGIRPTEGLVHPDELIDLGGYRVASLARAAFDEMRLARGIREAVVAIDMAISITSQVPHTNVDEIRRVIDSHFKVRGIVQARKALALADPRSASPSESRTRLIAGIDAGLSELLVNVPVFDDRGDLIGIVDLLEPASGLVIESDGDHHLDRATATADNHRQERGEQSGLTFVRITADDRRQRWATVGRIHRAHEQAKRRTDRRWTIKKPAWWAESRLAARWA